MKYKINGDDYEQLDDAGKALYTKSGDGYVLQVEGLPNASELESRVQQMDGKIAELLKEKKTEKEKADQAANDKARAEGDLEALDSSWKEKVKGKDQEISHLKGVVSDLTSGATAMKIAAEIAVSGSDSVLLPHIQNRLKTEIRDGVPVTVVLDPHGKPSALSVSELTEEIKSNPAFRPLIVGSRADGAGHHNSDDGSGGSVRQITRADFNKLDPARKSEVARSKDVEIVESL